jgi:hypothetical protein
MIHIEHRKNAAVKPRYAFISKVPEKRKDKHNKPKKDTNYIRSSLLRKILWNFKGESSNINTKAFCLPACLTKICHLVHHIEKIESYCKKRYL